MNPKRKGWMFLLVGLALLLGAGGQHAGLVARRGAEDLQVVPPEQTTPLVSLTTVAFGAFRGLVANALWMRAAELQQNGQFFELVQLAAWISQLEPTTPQVWEFQAWNLSYNISVLFPDPEDRWRWVNHGLDLLRKEGLRHNPNSDTLHWNMGWMFQHKIGMDFDQAHFHFKRRLAEQTEEVFGGRGPAGTGWEAAARETFRMDPSLILSLEERYGPLDWRTTEVHTLYWSERGLSLARSPFERRRLQRMRLQSLAAIMRRGDSIDDETGLPFLGLPRFELLPLLLAEQENALANDPDSEAVRRTARSFFADTALILALFDRVDDALEVYNRFARLDPDAPPGAAGLRALLQANDESMRPEDLSREQALLRVTALLLRSRRWETQDPTRARGLRGMASQLHRHYQSARVGPEHMERTGLPPFEEIERSLHARVPAGSTL